MQNVADQIARLTGEFQAGLQDLGIASKTPKSSVGPLVVVRTNHAAELVRALALRGVLVSPRLDGVRFSFHVYNDLSDVKAALAALEENLHLTARDEPK
jgi:selenocysteine lyase/cysteine desulfurase